MNIFQAIVLGIVQGATEFIPVSSSGHIVLVPWLLGWASPGLTFTVAVHFGTVFGVLTYFWSDWLDMARSTLRWISKRGEMEAMTRLLLLLVLGCIPAGIVGLLFEDKFGPVFEEPLLAASMLIVTALLLFLGERVGRQERDMTQMNWLDAIVIGVAQAVAIIPGISRSGSTITGGRLRHINREAAARFSFLLSTPIIIAAGLLKLLELAQTGIDTQAALVLTAGFFSAFVTAYFVIRWFLNYLKNRSVNIFAIYCVVAAIFSIIVWFIRG